MVPTTAGWLGWQRAPAQVDGLTYAAIAELGADSDDCQTLAMAFQQQRYVSKSRFATTWLPGCRHAIDQARARHRQELRQLDQAVDSAWQVVQTDQQEKARLAKARREQLRQAMSTTSSNGKEADAGEKNPPHQQRSSAQLSQQPLAKAQILKELSALSDLPLAYTVGQPSGLTLKRFLACLEVAYPNQGYSINQADGQLTVRALDADMMRGKVLIESRYSRVWDTWVLQLLRVQEIIASSAKDRYHLARNLLAGRCPPNNPPQDTP
ncbi:MAG: hypothetical protein R3292_09995 [Alcanivorax sp.]|nr:hypothetical protein [Alcanivorax sp.]